MRIPCFKIAISFILIFSGLSPGCEFLLGPGFAINRELNAIASYGISCTEENTELEFRFVSRTHEVEGSSATVYARGEVSGLFKGVKIDCICVEAISMSRKGGRWEVDGFPLDRMESVLKTLDQRHQAFLNRDLDVYYELMHPEYSKDSESIEILKARIEALLSGDMGSIHQEILSRTMRIERHEAIVTEYWKLFDGNEDERYKVARGQARYVLRPFSGKWLFAYGLM